MGGHLSKILLLLLLSSPVSAELLVLQWEIAVERTDGSFYLQSDRGGTEITFWVEGFAEVTKDVKLPDATNLSIFVIPGIYNVKARHYDKYGKYGPYGETIIKTVITPIVISAPDSITVTLPPKAPMGLR